MKQSASPQSTLLGCSPPPFAAALKRGESVCNASRSPLSSPFDDSGSNSSERESSPERGGIINEKKTNEGDTLDKSTSTSPTPSLAARRARVLGANVATVDASLPPIVSGKGARLFALAGSEPDEPDAPVASVAVADDASASTSASASDAEGRGEPPLALLVPYLDAQNNVAHLGHSHPGVAAAVSEAFSTLNTNSRYLHPGLVSHAEQLVELLSSSPRSAPSSTSTSSHNRNGVHDPVVYYVPSGTEANDLALRIARAFHEEEGRSGKRTGKVSPSAEEEEEAPTSISTRKHHRHHYLALEGAYHGHAGDPARVSSYVSFGGAVGSRCPEDVSLLRLPDSIRDRDDAGGAAAAFFAAGFDGCGGGGGEEEGESSSTPSSWDPAPAVRAAAAKACSSSSPAAAAAASLTAFIFESIPSCAGQVLLPKGWLAAAVAAARKGAQENSSAPPVIIADEVQTGLGRLGTLETNSFWAFQHFEVPFPDIVTVGKPAANGFPFGAVVASRRVASAFARNHPPFFSTFGGCTAAAAAALATLEALRRERLPERAAEVGVRLLRRLKEMTPLIENEGVRENLVIDVRGVGLMLGVEVAFCGACGFAAAPRVASFVAGHCRRVSKVLVSCDGAGERAASVLKIKPPLCFSHEDADELVEALRVGFEAVPAELLVLVEEEVVVG